MHAHAIDSYTRQNNVLLAELHRNEVQHFFLEVELPPNLMPETLELFGTNLFQSPLLLYVFRL